MSGSVLSVSSRALMQACERMGLDVDAILTEAALERSSLDDPDHRFPIGSVSRLWAAAYEATEDPDLALHAAAALPFGAYKVIDFLAWNAPTVGGALRQVSKYFPLINSAVQLPLTESNAEFHVGLVSSLGPATISRAYAEYSLAAVYLRTREATTSEFVLSSVRFDFPKPSQVTEHERIFQCPVHFGAACTEFRLEKAVWGAKLEREPWPF